MICNCSLKRNLAFAFIWLFAILFVYPQDGSNKTITEYQSLVNKYQQEGNTRELANYQAKLGYLFWEAGNTDKAIEFFTQAIQSNEKIGNENALRTLSSNIGLIYYDREEYEKALTWLRKSLQLNTKMRKRSEMAADYINIANALHELKQYQEAIGNIEKALPIFQESNEIKSIRSCYTSLSENYTKLGKSDKSKEYFDLAASINSKLQSEEIKQFENRTRDAEAVTRLKNKELLNTKDTLKEVIQLSYEKQMELNLLNNQKQLDSLKHVAREQTLLQQEIKRRNTIFTLGIILAMVVGFMFFVYRQLNAKKRANKLLEERHRQIIEQKKEIEAQHEIVTSQKQKITDSILYAQRIQKAILPPDDEFKKIFPEHFIYYSPRDIVSGDFYWLMQKEGIIILAAADCTGHGVPGAFMSMLGVAYLNEIVTNIGVNKHIRELQAHEILNQLREKFIQSLHQTGNTEENKDGMEISLCIFDIENKTLQFAGAHNPVYIIRNNEILKLDADKMPIGISANQNPFTYKEFELKHGDMLYLFSDGYYDQFGGPQGTKFFSGNFRKLLVEINQLPITEQKNRIENNIVQWKGEREQVDDMMVIGIRLLLEKDTKSAPFNEKKQILIAEDTEMNYILLVQALRNTNCRIFRAKNGQEAVDFCRANVIDMVLMDINMPVMDGIDATKIIRTFRPELPIIAQTALDVPGQKEIILEIGCNDYISKPIDLKEFLSTIKKYIDI
jgi:serine phosphatase RsbU (regulator of sigma subunit)/CheY-like chemotaxis protein